MYQACLWLCRQCLHNTSTSWAPLVPFHSFLWREVKSDSKNFKNSKIQKRIRETFLIQSCILRTFYHIDKAMWYWHTTVYPSMKPICSHNVGCTNWLNHLVYKRKEKVFVLLKERFNVQSFQVYFHPTLIFIVQIHHMMWIKKKIEFWTREVTGVLFLALILMYTILLYTTEES